LFEAHFRCLLRHFPDDPDLQLYVAAAYDIDPIRVESAMKSGANLNVTDIEIFNRYGFTAECIHTWRKLFLFFSPPS
jgi:hypothetical protein